jgi:hypothetical protein
MILDWSGTGPAENPLTCGAGCPRVTGRGPLVTGINGMAIWTSRAA